MLLDDIGTNYSLWLWVPACAGTTDGEWRHGKLFLRSHAQTNCVCRRPRRHTRESGYPVRRGLSIDHQLLCNTGSPAFAGDDTASDIRLRSHAQRAAFAGPPNRHTRESGYPVRRGLSIDHRLLCNTGSPAFAGGDTASDIRRRSHTQTAAFAAPPNRHTRESGYPVRRGLSIDHRLLCNTGSPAFAGDDTARDIRLRSHSQRAAFAAPPNRHTRESGYPVRRGLSIDHQLLCNTGSPAFAGDDGVGVASVRVLAARMRPSCARIFRHSHGKGVGNAGCRRTRSLACKVKKHTSWSPQAKPEYPAFPHTMVLTVTFVISPLIGLCWPRRLARLSATL